MTSVIVNNTALFLGANNKVTTSLEVPAGALRTIKEGVALTQKDADGTAFELHSENLAKPIQGVLNTDLEVAEDVGVTAHTVERVYDGHIDDNLFASQNGIANSDIIPAGGTYSYRLQMENKGFKVILRQPL